MPTAAEDLLRDLLATVPASPRALWSTEALRRGTALRRRNLALRAGGVVATVAVLAAGAAVALDIPAPPPPATPSASQGQASRLVLGPVVFSQLPAGATPSGPDATYIEAEGILAQQNLLAGDGPLSVEVFSGPGWDEQSVAHHDDVSGAAHPVSAQRRLRPGLFVLVSSPTLSRAEVRAVVDHASAAHR